MKLRVNITLYYSQNASEIKSSQTIILKSMKSRKYSWLNLIHVLN